MNTITDRDPIISYDAPSGRLNLRGQQRPQMLRNWAARIRDQEQHIDRLIDTWLGGEDAPMPDTIFNMQADLAAARAAGEAALAIYLSDPVGWLEAYHASLEREWCDQQETNKSLREGMH